MQPPNFEQTVKKIVTTDPRYHPEAYFFVRDALAFTRRNCGHQKDASGDVSSRDLLDGLRRYALETYGPMTPVVLAEWGVRSCEDIGEIVFHMIAHNCEGKTDTDNRDDFKTAYTFDDAFCKPFLPSARVVPQAKSVEA